jgi:hypothetical protein
LVSDFGSHFDGGARDTGRLEYRNFDDAAAGIGALHLDHLCINNEWYQPQ